MDLLLSLSYIHIFLLEVYIIGSINKNKNKHCTAIYRKSIICVINNELDWALKTLLLFYHPLRQAFSSEYCLFLGAFMLKYVS